MKKNKAKSERRVAARRRWFIFRDTRKAFQACFKSEGSSRAFLRSMKEDEYKFQFLKRPVS